MIVYEVDQLLKIYPGRTQPANDHISLQIWPGEIFGLLGDNGAGKSTLVRQMVNLLRPTAGRITFCGQPLNQAAQQVAMDVGYMPQSGRSLNNLTVGEALYFTAHLRGLSRHDSGRERDYLLDLGQIGNLGHQPSNRLSGGQGRLLQLAVAMAAHPPVLILDEPSNDLDPQRRKLVWEVIRTLKQERGTTIIFITHDAMEAEKVIERVGIMKNGQLVAVGRPADLKRKVDQKLRLELFFNPDCPPNLNGLDKLEVSPGRWLVYLDWAAAGPVLNQLNGQPIDDFRLYSATLEDLYLHFTS